MIETLLTEPNTWWLLLGGVGIGIFGVVVGGAQFFSIPLFQLLFPGIGLGALVANFKMGSFFRGIGSAVTTWSKINWKLIYSIVGWPILGTLGGAFFVSQASRAWILPSVILAVVVNEFFTHFKKDFPRKIRTWMGPFIGFYAGIFGAGIGLWLMAWLRLFEPSENKIMELKIQARFIEWLLVIVALLVYSGSGVLIFSIWFPWSVGCLLGGILGGYSLRCLGTLSGRWQLMILRMSYLVALVSALSAGKYFR